MEVKLKALELVDKFKIPYPYNFLNKQCALIAVDEVIEQEKNWIRQTGKGNSNYYKQVKQEIEKL